MESALRAIHAPPESFPSPPYLSVASKRVTYRDGRLELDNGRCRDTTLVVYFCGPRPAEDGELQAERGGRPARRRPERERRAHPALGAAAARRRWSTSLRRPGSASASWSGSIPSSGTLSSFDKVTLVLAKPLHGVVPKIVGLDWQKASCEAAPPAAAREGAVERNAGRRAGAARRRRGRAGYAGHRHAGKRRLTEPRALEAVAPRSSAARVIPIRGPVTMRGVSARAAELERHAVERQRRRASRVIAERLAELARARAEARKRVDARGARASCRDRASARARGSARRLRDRARRRRS